MLSFNSAWGPWCWGNAVFKYTIRAAQLGFSTKGKQFVVTVSEQGKTIRPPLLHLPHKEVPGYLLLVKKTKIKKAGYSQ